MKYWHLLSMCGLLSGGQVARAEIANGSFELGLQGWGYSAGIYQIGHSFQPIGVDGIHSADVGGGDLAGAVLWQEFGVIGEEDYLVTFATAANGVGIAGLVSVLEASVVSQGGEVLVWQLITNVSGSTITGDIGFVWQSLSFVAPAGEDRATLHFSDQTPNGGVGVDVVIDDVRLGVEEPPPPPPPPLEEVILNGSFELGLQDWSYSAGVYQIGHSFQPIGIDGNHSADLGGGDLPSAMMWQEFGVTGEEDYLVTFATAANGVGIAGLVSVLEASVVSQGGEVLVWQLITNVSGSTITGDIGFVWQSLSFVAPAGEDRATLRFSDQTPNGGVGVDVVIDDVRLEGEAPPPPPPPPPPLEELIRNGSFELGLQDWGYSPGVYQIGHSFQPIGVDGIHSADVGGGDLAGAVLWQEIGVIAECDYLVTFATAANGAGTPGRVSVLEASVVSQGGEVLVSQLITNESGSTIIGDIGFVWQGLLFQAPPGDEWVTLRFADWTPNGGVGIDIAIDDVRLERISPEMVVVLMIDDLIAAIDESSLPLKSVKPLTESLNAASRSMINEHDSAARGQLRAFRQKVEAQVTRRDPDLALALLSALEAILEEFDRLALE